MDIAATPILRLSFLAFTLTAWAGPLQAQCAGGNENVFVPASTPSSDFIESAEGTLVHTPTRRTWQRCALGQSWDGTTCTGTPAQLNWSDALAAAESHVQGGFDDWRLPNRNELASIIEDRCFAPAINAAAFPAAGTAAYWTSSPVIEGMDEVWRIDFADGVLQPAGSGSPASVRLVRGGPW